MTSDRLTVGVVTPHAAPGPEVELPAMTSGRIATILARTGSADVKGLRASTGSAAIDNAAVTFGSTALGAVAHASTTAGYVVGHRDETVAVERLAQRFGVPAVASCAAAVAALRTQEIERVQLVHPPWFDEAFDELGKIYFQTQGFDVVVTRAQMVPGDPARVETRHVVDWVERHVDPRAGAVFLAGNGFRAASAVAELELRTGRLMLAANQALLWGILTASDLRWDVVGCGRLLRAGT